MTASAPEHRLQYVAAGSVWVRLDRERDVVALVDHVVAGEVNGLA